MNILARQIALSGALHYDWVETLLPGAKSGPVLQLVARGTPFAGLPADDEIATEVALHRFLVFVRTSSPM
jgi:hypothetical protein